MLETADLNKKPIDKAEYRLKRDELMQKLILLQQQAKEEQLGLVVLFEGWHGAGKGSRISDMMYLLDARATSLCHIPDPPQEGFSLFATLDSGVTGYYPLMQPFWKELGERGTITFYEKGWYNRAEEYMIGIEHETWKYEARHHSARPRIPLGKLVERSLKPREELSGASRADSYLDSIASWERSLSENGYIVVKFFVHVSKTAQRERLEKLYSNEETRWRVSNEELLRCADYDELYALHDEMLNRSDFDFAPWHLLNGEDKRSANLEIAQTIVEALESGLAAKAKQAQKAAGKKKLEVPVPKTSRFPICSDYPNLDEVDHNLILSTEDYREQLKKEQKRLFKLELEMYQRRIPMMLMYEGWDAAGKGGAIKRVAQSLDARAYKIFPSPAPSATELAHPHLWRYWTRLPKAGHVGIYDRSWYGRVLVERIEGFASPEEVARSYDEINEFERDMVDWGAILVKFWVDVHPDEQLKRFQERQDNPAKQWKITDEDWRNREKNPQYYEAIQDMFRLTSTTYAPWTILESDNKQYARVKSLRVINEALEKRLGME